MDEAAACIQHPCKSEEHGQIFKKEPGYKRPDHEVRCTLKKKQQNTGILMEEKKYTVNKIVTILAIGFCVWLFFSEVLKKK